METHSDEFRDWCVKNSEKFWNGRECLFSRHGNTCFCSLDFDGNDTLEAIRLMRGNGFGKNGDVMFFAESAWRLASINDLVNFCRRLPRERSNHDVFFMNGKPENCLDRLERMCDAMPKKLADNGFYNHVDAYKNNLLYMMSEDEYAEYGKIPSTAAITVQYVCEFPKRFWGCVEFRAGIMPHNIFLPSFVQAGSGMFSAPEICGTDFAGSLDLIADDIFGKIDQSPIAVPHA